jgi:bifunctional DNase/RNase
MKENHHDQGRHQLGRMDLVTQQRVVLLQDEAGRTLPSIWVAAADAVALAIGLQKKPLARPMMPQLTVKLLQATGTQIEEVRIEAWKENVFSAVVKVRNGNVIQEIDARPSDALTLAVLADCPMYINEEIMQQQEKQIPEGETIETFLEHERRKHEQERSLVQQTRGGIHQTGSSLQKRGTARSCGRCAIRS